jgi:hypothetical protein
MNPSVYKPKSLEKQMSSRLLGLYIHHITPLSIFANI